MESAKPQNVGTSDEAADATQARLTAIESHLQVIKDLLIGVSQFNPRLDQINVILELNFGALAPGQHQGLADVPPSRERHTDKNDGLQIAAHLRSENCCRRPTSSDVSGWTHGRSASTSLLSCGMHYRTVSPPPNADAGARSGRHTRPETWSIRPRWTRTPASSNGSPTWTREVIPAMRLTSGTTPKISKPHIGSAPSHPLPEGDDPIVVATAFVARQNDGPGRILRLHARDADAYCSACRLRFVRWPCPAAAIALRALEMSDEICASDEDATVDLNPAGATHDYTKSVNGS